MDSLTRRNLEALAGKIREHGVMLFDARYVEKLLVCENARTRDLTVEETAAISEIRARCVGKIPIAA